MGDILLTETSSQSVQCLVNELNCQFALKDLGKLNYYLGFKANRNGSSLHLSQSNYASDLPVKTLTQDAKSCATPITVGTKLYTKDSHVLEDPTLYRSTIGVHQYLIMTRPYLSFVDNKLSQFLKAPALLQ